MEEEKYGIVQRINNNKNQNELKERKYRESRAKLKKNLEKRIRTTMIGAIAAIEEEFGRFWKNEDGLPWSEDQTKVYEIFQSVRAQILDNGNNQIRMLEKDMDGFNIEEKLYHIQLQVKPMERK